jgi:hypothetical protein
MQPEQLDRQERGEQPVQARKGAAGSVLRLQQTAGNRQVARLLSGRRALARQPDRPGKAGPPARSARPGITITVEGAPGLATRPGREIEAETLSLGPINREHQDSRDPSKQTRPSEVTLTRRPDWSTLAWRRALEAAEPLKKVVIVIGGDEKITLADVTVLAYDERDEGGAVSERIVLGYSAMQVENRYTPAGHHEDRNSWDLNADKMR